MASLSYDEVKRATLEALARATPLPLEDAKQSLQTELLSKLEFCKEEPDPKMVSEQRAAADHSLSTFLEQMCDTADAKGQTVQEAGINNFLDLSLYMSEQGLTDKISPFSMIESLFESQTISGCERAWDYIESRSSTLLSASYIKRGKLTVLRMCNEVLRRLSKTTNTVFAGRLLIFLAGAFPLSERSAVNVKSSYNTANVTGFEEEPSDAFGEQPESGVELEEKVVCGDANFYKIFWSLQQYFAEPTKLFSPQDWITFQTQSKAVLEAFEAHWISAVAADASIGSEQDDFYFPKFLTSSNLMNLQLNDAYFCRHILVQFLILVQCLLHHKSRLPPVQNLTEQQKKILKGFEARVFSLLDKIAGAKGKKFRESVSAMLQRELHWILWKREGCNAFERKSEEGAEGENAQEGSRKRRIFEVKDVWGSNKKGRLGQAALSRLWAEEGGELAGLADEKQKYAPSLEDLIKPVLEELDPENGIEARYRSTNSKLYTWRAMRQVSKHALGKIGKGECNLDMIAKELEPMMNQMDTD